jgi:threonine synthase
MKRETQPDHTMTAQCVGISKAVEIGANTIGTCSSGNAAASLAAYSTKAGLEYYAFVLDIAPEQKLVQIRTYGGKVVKVSGLEKGADPTVTLLKEAVSRYGWILKNEAWNILGKKVTTRNICRSTEGNRDGMLTTPIAATVMLWHTEQRQLFKAMVTSFKCH